MSRDKITIDEVRRKIKAIDPDVVLLSDSYINNKSQLYFRCSCGKIFTKNWDTIQARKSCKCRSCARKIGWEKSRRPDDFRQKNKEIFLQNGYKPLEEICSTTEKILCEDTVGYRGRISLENVKLGKHFSIFSLRFNKENLIYNLQQFAKENDADVIVISYKESEKTCSTKIKCKCACGEEFYSNLGDFLGCKHWRCPKCSKARSTLEILTEKELFKYTKNIISQKRFRDCINCETGYTLPFDFYLPDLNLCIEVDGEQHIKPSKFSDISDAEAEEKLKERVRLDNIKNEYCNNHNIHLIRISYKKFGKRNEYKIIIKNIFG